MTKLAYTPRMSDKDIDAGILSIARRSTALQTDIQMVAVSILAAFHAHGDKDTTARRANALVQSTGKGARHNALLAWFELFAPMVYNKDAKALVCAVTASNPVKTHQEIDLSAAVSSPWWDAAAEPEYKPIADMNAAIHTLIKRMETDIEKMGDKSKVNPAKLNALKALAV